MARRVFGCSWLLAANIITPMGKFAQWNDSVPVTRRRMEAASRNRYVPPYAMALVHAGLRENDLALEWLNRAHDAHLALLTVDPKWDAFRADPRFMDLLGRCAFANPAVVAPLDS